MDAAATAEFLAALPPDLRAEVSGRLSQDAKLARSLAETELATARNSTEPKPVLRSRGKRQRTEHPRVDSELRFAASGIAALCSFHPYADIPEVFTKLVYQVRRYCAVRLTQHITCLVGLGPRHVIRFRCCNHRGGSGHSGHIAPYRPTDS